MYFIDHACSDTLSSIFQGLMRIPFRQLAKRRNENFFDLTPMEAPDEFAVSLMFDGTLF